MNNKTNDTQTKSEKMNVPFTGYIALVFAMIFFSGLFASSQGWLSVFDFSTINGSFGTMKTTTATFVGQGGFGAREGFLFGLSLIPGVMLALGAIEIIQTYGGLLAAQKLLTKIVRPIMGIPGMGAIAVIASFQSMDATGGIIKGLKDDNMISEKERLTLCAWSFSGGGTLVNYFAIISALFAYFTVPIGLPLAVIFGLKLFGANVMRIYAAKIKA